MTIRLEKDNHSFVSKADVGLAIVLFHLVFLPSPVSAMGRFAQPAPLASTFGEKAKYLAHSHPFPLLSRQRGAS